MEFVLSALPLFYRNLSSSYSDTMLIVTQRIMRFILVIIKCLSIPFCRIRGLKKRKLLPPITNKLLLSSATQIAQRIRRREISSEDVIRAYVERCKDVNPIINAIVENRFEAAIQDARSVDNFLKSTTKTEDELARDAPLLGVPLTVKESIAVQGMSYSVGVTKDKSEKAQHDATIVRLARDAGAIILLVSNTPELCLFWETCNKLTGTTCNPYDTNRSPGGSSGGEAALLSSAASVLSLASDIAGSVRLPAMFCGVYGHKPSPGWVPHCGHKPESHSEDWPQFFTLGSMVRYIEDLPLLLKVISQSEEARRRLDQKVSLKNMRFYYMEESSVITTPIDDDVKWAIHKLKTHVEREHGVEVRKVHIDEMNITFNMTTKILLSINVDWNGLKAMDSIFLETLKFIFRLSSHMMHVVLYGLMAWVAVRLPRKYHARMLEKRASMKKQFEELLGDNGVIICPSFVTAAYYPYEAYYNSANFTHLTLYNVLGLPVTQCPIGLNGKGLPVGLQIVANAGCDHLSIAVAQEVERAFGGWQLPSSKNGV